MKQTQIGKTHIEDSFGIMQDAVNRAFSHNEQIAGQYAPDKQSVPQPNFELLNNYYNEVYGGFRPKDAYLRLTPKDTEITRRFLGLRGHATFMVQTSVGNKPVKGPAIVLSTGSEVAVLTAEAETGYLTELQHAFLDTEYIKHDAKVSPEHRSSDVVNAGSIAPALVVASSLISVNAHRDLHGLAAGHDTNGSFGANFSAAGRQDLIVGGQTLRLRSVILPLKNVIFDTSAHDQPVNGAALFDTELSANELAIGMTLAATISRQGKSPDLAGNLHAMVSA